MKFIYEAGKLRIDEDYFVKEAFLEEEPGLYGRIKQLIWKSGEDTAKLAPIEDNLFNFYYSLMDSIRDG